MRAGSWASKRVDWMVGRKGDTSGEYSVERSVARMEMTSADAMAAVMALRLAD